MNKAMKAFVTLNATFGKFGGQSMREFFISKNLKDGAVTAMYFTAESESAALRKLNSILLEGDLPYTYDNFERVHAFELAPGYFPWEIARLKKAASDGQLYRTKFNR